MSSDSQVDYIIKIVDSGTEKLTSITKTFDILNRHADKFKEMKIDSPMFRQLTRDAKAFRSDIAGISPSVDMLRQRLSRLQEGHDKAFRTDQIERYRKMIESTRKELERMQGQSKIQSSVKSSGTGGIGAGMGSMLGMMGGVGLLYSAGSMAMGMVNQTFDATAKYEKMSTILRNTFQNNEKARDSMSMIVDFAAKTPFQIDELTDSFIRLVNRGFTPSMSQMTLLGDLASSQGKGFTQLTEAILDAETGEFERLKEFGIKASVNNDKVTFSFKNQKTTIKNTTDGIRQYVLSLGNMAGVAGGMAAVTKTLSGQVSNLKDSWDQTMMMMGNRNRGVFNDTISLLSSGVNLIKNWAAVPLSDTLMDERSEMNALVGVITDHNTSSTTRLNLLQELASKYPEIFGNIDIEKVKNDELLKKLNEINSAYEKRIQLAASKETESSVKQDKDEAQNEVQRIQMQIQRLKNISSGKNSHLRQKDAEQLYSSTTFGESFTVNNDLGARLMQGDEAGLQKRINTYMSYYMGKLKGANAELMAQEQTYQAATSSRQEAERAEIAERARLFYQSLWIGSESFKKIIGGDKKIYGEFIKLFQKSKKDEDDYKRLEEIITGKVSGKKTPGPVFPTATGTNTGTRETINSINSGGTRPTSVVIHIQKIQDKTEIHVAAIKEGTQKMEGEITNALLRAVNSMNTVGQ